MQQRSDTIGAKADIAGLSAQCVMCGLCLPHCPSYRVEKNETDSPRGRLALMAALAAQEIVAAAHPSLDRCLACGACEPVCPAKVQYLQAITLTRTALAPSSESFAGKLARRLAKRPRLAAALIATATRIRRVLPAATRRRFNLDGFARVAAKRERTSRPKYAAPSSDATMLFAGCSSRALEARTIEAMHRIAEHWRTPLLIVQDECCGALDRHLGRAEPTMSARDCNARTCVSINSGCAAQWQHAVPTGEWRGVGAWLDQLAAEHASTLNPQSLRVVLHVPCSQALLRGETEAVARMLQRIPGVELLSMPTQPKCCGAAATYFLNQPAASQRLADEMADRIIALQAEVIVSANGGCRAQLAQALHERGSTIRLLHPAELLAENLIGSA